MRNLKYIGSAGDLTFTYERGEYVYQSTLEKNPNNQSKILYHNGDEMEHGPSMMMNMEHG